MEKQTAVGWLVEQIIKHDKSFLEFYGAEIEQAEEMNKQEMIDFANNYGFDKCGYDYERAEQYYNQTFKN